MKNGETTEALRENGITRNSKQYTKGQNSYSEWGYKKNKLEKKKDFS